MNAIDQVILNSVQLGAVEALRLAGVSSGEISQRKASETYGRWFEDAVAAGKLRPVHIGKGANGKRLYAISDILRLKTAEAVRAELKNKNNQNL